MADIHSKKIRSYNMSQIRGRGTKPELKIKNFLNKKGFVYQSKSYGKPDFINYKKKIVLFVDGCFWHKCTKCFRLPKTNKKFWEKKINENSRRDKEITFNYKNSGWSVVRIWEHELRFLNTEMFNKL